MPGVDRTQGGALALHYAAARGCLECVKLLVETSPDFRSVSGGGDGDGDGCDDGDGCSDGFSFFM